MLHYTELERSAREKHYNLFGAILKLQRECSVVNTTPEQLLWLHDFYPKKTYKGVNIYVPYYTPGAVFTKLYFLHDLRIAPKT